MLSASSFPEPQVLAALPIFPLPNVVLLPGMVLPLNVFEPRYLQLVDHALADGHHIGVPLLRRHADATARGPAIEPVFGLGKLVSHLRVPDGRRLIRLEGLGRVRQLAELPSPHLYRLLAVEPLPERPLGEGPSLGVLHAHITRIAQLCADEGDALRSLITLPDPRILLYALTAYLPALEFLADPDPARDRLALVELQQRSLNVDTDERLELLVERTAHILGRLARRAPDRMYLN